jgi:hypothetical protein
MAKEKNKKAAEVEETAVEPEENTAVAEDDLEGAEDNENEGVDDADLPEYMKVGRDTVDDLDDATKVQYLEELTKAMFGYSADFMNQADAFGARNILIGAGRARKAAVMFRKCVTAYRLLSIHVARLKRAEKAEAKESKRTAEAEEAKAAKTPKKAEEKAPAAKPAAKKPAKK